MIGLALRRLGVLTAGTFGVIALAAIPTTAQAALANLDACDGSTLTQPFTPWADFDYYKVAPGGDFETGASGWSLQGRAAVVGGSETFNVSGSAGSSSLSLPAGAVASSPQTCVDAAYPTFRFFMRTDNPGTTVTVSAVYQTAAGTTTIPVGVVTPTSSWEPTAPLLTGSAIPGALNGTGYANVSLQFTSSGGTAQVDDVYVDPFRCC